MRFQNRLQASEQQSQLRGQRRRGSANSPSGTNAQANTVGDTVKVSKCVVAARSQMGAGSRKHDRTWGLPVCTEGQAKNSARRYTKREGGTLFCRHCCRCVAARRTTPSAVPLRGRRRQYRRQSPCGICAAGAGRGKTREGQGTFEGLCERVCIRRAMQLGRSHV